jgi:alpha-glucosidase (family GH31 glycosyl hydrolase)
VKQFVDEKVDEPLSISIYPGADASFLLYEDDGISFNYRKGQWTGIQKAWDDKRKELSLQLAQGSRMLSSKAKVMTVKLADATKNVSFEGKPVEVSF